MAGTTKMISFNCKNVMRSVNCVRSLCRTADIVALQETWLLPHDIQFLGSIDDNFAFTGNSSVDTSVGVLSGRPYGGVALLWRKAVFPCVSVLECKSTRLAAIKITQSDRAFLIITVYMPYERAENLIEFTNCLSEIYAIVESNDVETVFVLGDFNAHPGESFTTELLNFCNEQSWSCIDMELLPSDTYTFVSDANGRRRWLDHCVVTAAARDTVLKVSVVYGVYWSDHTPFLVECNIKAIKPKTVPSYNSLNKVQWGERDDGQIDRYHGFCHSKLKDVDFSSEFVHCANKSCSDGSHKLILDNMYHSIVCILSKAAELTYKGAEGNRRYKCVPGWNKHVGGAHREARHWYQTWLMYGKPSSGYFHSKMCESRKTFKAKLKYCQDNEKQIKLDIIAQHHTKKQFGKFWKGTNRLNPKTSLPVSVAGTSDPRDIANKFQRHFRVQSQASREHVAESCHETEEHVRFSAKQVAGVIKGMVRGKSPGHDSLSIEHLKYAGVHLPRVLALFFNLCISHCHLPDDLMYTLVVPIMKNRTGDASDLGNYRPISLATVIAKVLDSLLDKHLGAHIELQDNQFGFRPSLSTESAILCLKQTVQYYTERNTPVFACFLDLSKAFDLVSYDVLWKKMVNDTTLPLDIVSIFKYWYSNQRNSVRWAGVHSDMYRLECGVRQGGLTSPKLFNLYMNRLIEELNSTNVGCHIDGVSVNNISYADDMVLLSPSIGALQRLLHICEAYAESHGLRYNVSKSEFLIFKAGSKTYSTPPVTLCGTEMKKVDMFKYLGHWVTDTLSDNVDIERERRALAVRCNMLARRFARCTKQVKVTLFKAYCQSFYTCSLWTEYTRSSYGALRVQYNNAFRVLFGLPRFCSASKMFADHNTDCFFAIIRKRCASLLRRLRSSSNGILSVLTDRWDSPLLGHWMRLHTEVDLQIPVTRRWEPAY
ncbi:uncharacterized protein LOC126378053 [Pectinophora gossypiella]|uniref:uncharacterized protein LOC126378053 n=1 Tax=Pectinophora gossypiella TaxID=13191 RepID=UPI00214EA296|nr:uncharacterized protein LOC126378053 [Pectinophora gossypiella]